MLTSNIVFFPCKNLMDTQEFYSCVVGISVHRKMDNSIIFDSGYGYLGFCKYSDDRPMANGVCISFNAQSREDVDCHYHRIIQQRPQCIMQPPKQHENFPVYSFFMKDPNGYLVEIQKIDD